MYGMIAFSPFNPTFPLLVCVAFAAGCERKPSLQDELSSLQTASDAAFLAFKMGDYETFAASIGNAQAVRLRLHFESELPQMSVATMKAEVCDSGAIDGYLEALQVLLEPALPLLSQDPMSLSQQLDTANFLDDLATAARLRREPLSGTPDPQQLACDRISPGLSSSIIAVEDYAKDSLGGWELLYKEKTGNHSDEVARASRESKAKMRRTNNPNNWRELPANEKHYYTLGDSEVADCVSSFVGAGGVPAGVTTRDVSDLCRQGLRP